MVILTICWDRIYSLDDKVVLIQENVRLLYDSYVPVKTRLAGAKYQLWFNDEIKVLIDKRDIGYLRWKRFRVARCELTKRIKI